jgi:hypothetical protein
MTTTENINECVSNLMRLEDMLKFNPTVIYNEGWMVRLLVAQSIETGITIKSNGKQLNFAELKGKNWISEVSIASPFGWKEERDTHPDILFGDFKVDFEKEKQKGRIDVCQGASMLGIIEAKMKSPLSQRTKENKDYNQATRSICCLAHNIIKSANEECDIYFIVAAPKSQIETKSKAKNTIAKSLKNIYDEIKERVNKPDSVSIDKDTIIKITNRCTVFSISYEDWIQELETAKVDVSKLNKFYKSCLEYNKVQKQL